MKEFILLLPIIFIFHDMEEVVGFGYFFKKNPDLYDRFPRVMKAYRNFKTEGFAAAVYEESKRIDIENCLQCRKTQCHQLQ